MSFQVYVNFESGSTSWCFYRPCVRAEGIFEFGVAGNGLSRYVTA
jgi:hypothetical protein